MFWRLVDTDLATPVYSAACDEAIVKAREKNIAPNTLHFYRRDRPTVSLGYFERVEEAVDVEAARRYGVQLIRRFSGGSAIYTDPDQIVYAAVMRRERLPEDPNEIYEMVCSALIRGLEKLGLEAEYKPINDVRINGRKVSGSAQKIEKNVIIQHGTIIMDCDFDLMFKVLKTGEKKIRTKSGMTSLSKELGRQVSADEVKSALVEGFEEALNVRIRKGTLTHFEEGCIEHLIESKYGTEKYTFMR